MWCRTVRKVIDEYIYGTLSSRKEKRVRAHLASCEACRAEEDDVRLVHDALSTWPDLPAPEDGFNRLDSRLSFAPPPAIPLRPRRVRHLVVPYVAGLATAACLMLIVTKPWNDTPPLNVAPPANEVLADSNRLLPGERPLAPITVDTGDGYLLEIPVDAATWQLLDERSREEILRRPRVQTVDYEAK